MKMDPRVGVKLQLVTAWPGGNLFNFTVGAWDLEGWPRRNRASIFMSQGNENGPPRIQVAGTYL